MTTDNLIVLICAVLGSTGITTVVMYFIVRNDSVRILFKDRVKQYCEFLITKGEVSQQDHDYLITLHEHYNKKYKDGNGILADRMAKVKEVYDAGQKKRLAENKPTSSLPPEPVKEKPHVLAIDDQETWRKLVERALRAEYDVHTLDDSAEAMMLIRQINPAVIILDNMMLPITGVELTREIRKQPRYQNTPIIMLTGSTEKHILEEAFDAGIDDYIAKPFDARKLLDTVAHCIRNRKR